MSDPPSLPRQESSFLNPERKRPPLPLVLWKSTRITPRDRIGAEDRIVFSHTYRGCFKDSPLRNLKRSNLGVWAEIRRWFSSIHSSSRKGFENMTKKRRKRAGHRIKWARKTEIEVRTSRLPDMSEPFMLGVIAKAVEELKSEKGV